MSISPSAEDSTTITASDENSRNNEVSTKFNAHDHNDIDQTANTLNVGDATAGNKTITANNADTNKPFLRYDDTNNIWVVSVDGSNVSAVVTRTGSSTNYRTLPETPAQGDILYADGSNWVSLAKGTAGQVLEINAGATAPEWDTDDSGMQYTDTRHYVGSFTRDMTVETGTAVITGVGFQPVGLDIIGTLGSAEEGSWGFSNVTTNVCIYQRAGGGVATTTSYAGVISDAGTANYQGVAVSAVGADGFTLSYTKAGSPTGTATFRFRAHR